MPTGPRKPRWFPSRNSRLAARRRRLQNTATERLEDRYLLAAVAWDGGGDGTNWHDPRNWDSDVVPGAGNEVTIDIAGTPTIQFSGASGSQSVASIATAETLEFTGGTLSDATISTLPGGSVRFAGVPTLRSVTLDTDATVVSGRLETDNGLTVNDELLVSGFSELRSEGTQVFDGTGTIRFARNAVLTVQHGTTLTIGSDLSIGGAGIRFGQKVNGNGPTTLINEGTLFSDDAGIPLRTEFDTLTNSGRMLLDGGNLTLGGDWQNTGVIDMLGGTLNLGGTFEFADLGTFNRTGGTVNVMGLLENTGRTVRLDAVTGSWFMQGGTIDGGAVESVDGAQLQFAQQSSSTLRGVTLNSDVTLSEFSARAVIENGLTVNSELVLDDFAELRSDVTQTFDGTGRIRFASQSSLLTIQHGTTLTIGADLSIGGVAARLGQKVNGSSPTTLINTGTLFADGTGIPLRTEFDTLTSSGRILLDGGNLTLGGNWQNTGVIDMLGGTLNLGGTFEFADLGTFDRTGGTVNVTGLLENTGRTVRLDAVTGSWFMQGGTIDGGVIESVDGAQLQFAQQSSSTLRGVTLNSDVTLSEFSARAIIEGGVTVNAELVVSRFAELRTGETQTFGGTGSIQFTSRDAVLTAQHGTTLTIGSDLTIGGAGVRFGQKVNGSAPTRLINNGLFVASDTTGALQVDFDAFDNDGSVDVRSGATLRMGPQGNRLLNNNGVLGGEGTIDGNVISSGIVRPGSSPGRLTVDGNYTQNTDGTLEVQIAGRAAGTEFDQLDISGTTLLDGTLNVTVISGFSPTDGDAFPALLVDNASGEFGTVNLPDISPLEFRIVYDDLSVRAEVQPKTNAGPQPTISGTAAPGAVVSVKVDSVTQGTAVADAAGVWSFATSLPGANEHLIEVTGEGPARINLAAPLQIADEPVGSLEGLTLSDDALIFYPFGTDLDGVLEPNDVVIRSSNSRLGLQTALVSAAGTVGLVQRRMDGRLLLDQETIGDPLREYTLVNESLLTDIGLASVLPFRLRRIAVSNIDTSDGFSAELIATGTFDIIEFAKPLQSPERVSRDAVREYLEQTEEPELIIIASLVQPILTDIEEGVAAVLGPGGPLLENIRTVEDLEAAEEALAYSFRFEAELAEFGIRDLFEGQNAPQERREAMAEMFSRRNGGVEVVLNSAVGNANEKQEPTADDFEFVKSILSFASTAEQLGFPASGVETVVQLRPAIESEIERLQFEARSQTEIADGIDHAIVVATAAGEDIHAASLDAIRGFIDTLIARVAANQPEDADRQQMANTAVQLAVETLPLEGDPVYGQDAVVERIRAFMPGYQFDSSNLLPESLPEPEPEAPGADPRAFVLVGDLPLDEDGRLTTEGVTGLIDNVPEDLSLIAPLQDDLEFRFVVSEQGITPVSLPTLTVAFDNLQVGKNFEMAGFVSLGAYGDDGVFEKGTFAGGVDLSADIAGYQAGLGITLDGTTEGNGFFPSADMRGGTIVTDAAIDFDFRTSPDLANAGFFLDLQSNAQFDMRMEIDATRGFRFEDFGLREIAIEELTAAFGGTAPDEGADSAIPDDALVLLATEDFAVNLADDDEPLFRIGELTVSLPNAPGALQNLSATVTDFGMDVVGGELTVLLDGFGFNLAAPNLKQTLQDLGVPDFIEVRSLGFEAGNGFFDAAGRPGDLTQFSLLVSGGIQLPEPINFGGVDVEGMRIDVGALRSGNLLEAVSFQSIEVQIGPFGLGENFRIGGGFVLETIEFARPGDEANDRSGKSILMRINADASFSLPEIVGVGAEVVISEFGVVGMGLTATDVVLGTSGLTIRELTGRVTLNAPEIRAIEPGKPLDLFKDSSDPGVVDFSDLAGPLSLQQLRGTTRQLLERSAAGETIDLWHEPMLFAVDLDLGITGDVTNSLLLETTVGTRIDPGSEELDLQIFGLGSLSVLPDTPNELLLGEAGVLIDARNGEVTVSAAFQTGDREELDIPARVGVGAQLIVREGGQIVELIAEAEVSVDGFTGTDESSRPLVIEGGGVLVIEQNVGMYGAVQIDVEVGQRDDFFIGGELFVRFNSDSVAHDLDLNLARAQLPRLIELDPETGAERATIPAGFGLFALVEVQLGELLTASGSLEIEADPAGLRAALDLEGSMYGGVVRAGLSGELILANVAGETEFRRLNVDAFIDVVLLQDFLQTRGEGNLLITDAGLQNLSVNAEGVFFGFAFENVGGSIDKHGCVELTFGDGAVDFPLPGGACGVPDEPDPTRLNLPSASFIERDVLRTVNVPVEFEGGSNRIIVPSGVDPEITLEYWTLSRPDDTAVGLADSGDYRKVERARVTVTGRDPITLPGTGGLRSFALPRTVNLPVDLFGDRSIEADETFSVFVQPVLPEKVGFPSLVRETLFGRITLENDDVEVLPPDDAVVFFDFDRLRPNGEFAFEAGPDASRPQFTFDLNRVSPLTHTVDNVTALSAPRNGLPREQGVSRAATGVTWAVPELSDTANDRSVDAIAGDLPGRDNQPDLNLASQREYFEFSITAPAASRLPGQFVTQLSVSGIDFYDRADTVGLGSPQWEVRYSLDGFASVLASGTTHIGAFGHNRVAFNYPLGRSAALAPGQQVTYRLSGPENLVASGEDRPWHIDNLALIGSRHFTLTRPVGPTDQFPPLPDRTRNRSTASRTSTGIPVTTRTEQRRRLDEAVNTASRTGRLSNGFLSAASVFFDSNANGTPDPGEPVATTDAGGLFQLLIPAEFDQDRNGQFEPSEGVLVSSGGVDQGTALEQTLRFRAPADAISITPLTTLIASLAARHSLTVSDAHDLVRSRLRADNGNLRAQADLLNEDSIEEINNGNAFAIRDYVALVQVHTTALLTASALADTADGIPDSGDATFDAVADELNASDSLSLTSRLAVRRILDTAAAIGGRAVTEATANAVVAVIVSANQAAESVDAPAGLEFLIELKRLQRVIHRITAAEIAQHTAGTLTATDLRDRNSVENLRARAANEAVGTVFPVTIQSRSAAITEPDAGAVDLEFTAILSAPSPLPVTVDYATVGSTASAGLDFTPVNGTLTFGPGETEKTLRVSVLADDRDELAEVFHLQFSNPQHALLDTARVTGTIRMPADTSILPAEFSLGDTTAAAVSVPIDLELLLPGVVSGTVDWGDGTTSPVDLSATADGVRVTARHAYAATGVFNIELSVTAAAGGTSIGRGVAVVEEVLTRPAADEPDKAELTIVGTESADRVRLAFDPATAMVEVTLNRRRIGAFEANRLARIFVQLEGGDDLLSADAAMPVAIVVEGGDGDDVIRTGAGNDRVVAGNGADFIQTRGGDDTVDAGAGADVVFGNRGRDRIQGGADRDYLSGGHGHDTVEGGGGRDTLFGARGHDVLSGGPGSDRIYGGSAADAISGDAGNDLLVGGAGSDNLHGGNGKDRLSGGSGDDTLSGGTGADRILGGRGDDLLRGGDNDDSLNGSAGLDLLFGESGHDELVDLFGPGILVGGDGDDKLRSGPNRDLIIGGRGRDRISAGREGDVIIGGWTDHDHSPAALRLLLNQWQSGHSRRVRIRHLKSGSGDILGGSGIRLRRGDTVHDDKAGDLLFYPSRLDWLLLND